MSNIIDYIQWRGDLSFNQAPFNEIDNLILSRISYFPFDGLIDDKETITLKEAYTRFQKLDLSSIHMLQKEDTDLFPEVAYSERFGKLYIKYYINKRDAKAEKQFSAITFILPDGTIYVAYRGTDNTLVGWKEDFNMSFMESIPSQEEAKNYLNKIATELKDNIRVGGHSKGGNLAVYAAAFCNDNIKTRILEVYNNDGPGFFDSIINTEEYQTISDKIHTFIPQTSIIGRMLKNEGKCTVVESTEFGIYQHSLYSWQVLGNKFIEMKQVTKESEFIDKSLKKWLMTVSSEQREKFWVALFEIMSSTNKSTLYQMKSNWFESSKKMFTTYKNLDDETRKIVNETVKCFFSIMKENVKEREKRFSLRKEINNEG
ncbi:MAG: DUF2974 domain-containing protein [Clostridia bacterium]|nr:DUF2974 domain-containing protein [Clostridia bacterium]